VPRNSLNQDGRPNTWLRACIASRGQQKNAAIHSNTIGPTIGVAGKATTASFGSVYEQFR
jgi:hypothetical protein